MKELSTWNGRFVRKTHAIKQERDRRGEDVHAVLALRFETIVLNTYRSIMDVDWSSLPEEVARRESRTLDAILRDAFTVADLMRQSANVNDIANTVGGSSR